MSALMTGEKQQQIVTLMHRHFSKEIMYSYSCFLWCFVVTFLFWWCENSSFFVSPAKPADLCFSEILSILYSSILWTHLCNTSSSMVSDVCRLNVRETTSVSAHTDYSMCPSVICLYALMAFFVKSNLKIVRVLRRRWRSFHWPFSFYFWDRAILFDPPIEMLYCTVLWSVGLIFRAVGSVFHSRNMYESVNLLT